VGTKRLSVCQPTLVSSSMTARDVANGSSRTRAIVACSALTVRCRVHQCRLDVAATSAFALLRHFATLTRVKEHLVDPKDIATLAVFLASDSAKSISGQMLPIDCDMQTTT
jgi:enoyl-[acyl-carrier-protein] reductase (NADH)